MADKNQSFTLKLTYCLQAFGNLAQKLPNYILHYFLPKGWPLEK